MSDYNGFRGGPQSDIPHKAAENTEALFFSDLCASVWDHKKIPHKAAKNTEALFLCDLRASVWDHKKIPHKAAKNTEALFSLISVPLCGIIKKSHTKPQRTRRLCDLCASVWDHKKNLIISDFPGDVFSDTSTSPKAIPR
ncbi:MAG: hypothetical protein B6245_01280 [Desulfobacteraceae bacterium 4572_88]|nr:MAG: hypothetical protein B6245_01280 [Desulfobacteraceae bacterium 4572_88]